MEKTMSKIYQKLLIFKFLISKQSHRNKKSPSEALILLGSEGLCRYSNSFSGSFFHVNLMLSCVKIVSF